MARLAPHILQGFDTEDGTPVGDEPHEAPAMPSVELVPADHYDAFRRDTRSALQEFSGIPVSGSDRLLPSWVDLEACLELSAREGVVNPLLGRAELLEISTHDPYNIWDYIDSSLFVTRHLSRFEPLRHPGSRRYAHVDLALVSAAAHERRLRFYRHPLLLTEMARLIDCGKKFDAPAGGTKDVADAVAGTRLHSGGALGAPSRLNF